MHNYEPRISTRKNLFAELISKIKNRLSNKDYDLEMRNFCNEDLPVLLKYFLEVKKVRIKPNNQFLLLASERGNMEVVKILNFLLEIML